jgi:hypothetical protein
MTNAECERLQEILDLLSENMPRLRDREKQFVDDQIKRYEEFGAEMRLTPRQWAWLNDLESRFA